MSEPLPNLELYKKIQNDDFITWFGENKKRIEWRSVDFDKLFQNIKSITNDDVIFNNLTELGSRLVDIVGTYKCEESFPIELPPLTSKVTVGISSG